MNPTLTFLFAVVAAFAQIPASGSDASLMAGNQTGRPQTPVRAIQQPLDWEKLTERQLKELPDTQAILFQGKRTTLGDVRARLRAWQLQTAARRARTTDATESRVKARSRQDQSVRAFNQEQQKQAVAAATAVKSELMRLKDGTADFPAGDIPRITKVFGVIQPGGAVLIGGEGFGSKPGRVRMLPSGASWELLLEQLEWYPSGIGGRIPNNPALVKGAQARFVVETSSGAASFPWSVNWIVEIKQLPINDVRNITCSTDANINLCSNGPSSPVPCTAKLAPFSLPSLPSLEGKHENCWGAIGDDSGVDVYEITLKNGWTLHQFQFGSHISTEGEGFVSDPGVFPVGSTYWKPSFAWSVTPSDRVIYWADIYIRGPKGVPHK